MIVPCIALSASMLTACATPTPPSTDRQPLPPSLTTACPDLTPLDDAQGGSVLRKLIETSEMYYECRRRHRALADAVK